MNAKRQSGQSGPSGQADQGRADREAQVAPLTEEATAIVALAAHELKNALGGIGVAIARCEQKVAGGKTVSADDLSLARTELRRLSALVNDLLDGARVDLGQVHVHKAAVDIAALTAEVVATFRAARERPVKLDLPARATVIDCDADRVRAVLVNYLENAAKYAPAPAEITVSVGPAPDATRFRIAVKDDGPGIPREDQARIFQRFFRSPTVAKRTSGLGLGLYLCHAIAQAHGGATGVDSSPGGGATFWLDLPGTSR
ncbi:MAG: HAMP domain-containing sensor histidine kinase [Bacteroidota bacterium]